MKQKRTKGFTLVEVLIVVVILAVLAATIIPKFASSTNEARTSNAVYNLHVLRSQIEMYRAQHEDIPPTVAAISDQLTQETNLTGVPTVGGDYGPYVQMIPDNPFTKVNTIVDAGDTIPPVAAVDGAGWLYDEDTGQIWINELDHLEY